MCKLTLASAQLYIAVRFSLPPIRQTELQTDSSLIASEHFVRPNKWYQTQRVKQTDRQRNDFAIGCVRTQQLVASSNGATANKVGWVPPADEGPATQWAT